MKITELKYTERKNMGNYEHAELSATALVEEGEDINAAVLTLKTYVSYALNGEISKIEVKEEIKPEPVVEAPVKEKKPKAKKEKVVEPVVEPVVEEAPVKKNVVIYNSNIQEHKSILAGYLSEKYKSEWKTVAPAEEIKQFTSSLNGNDFLDDSGKIVDSFLALIHGFFGA